MPETIDWPLHTQPAKPRNFRFLILIAIVAIILLGGRTALSYWVDLLWFRSLGYGEVFWKTRWLEWGVFAGFALVTFLVLLGAFFALKRAHAGDLPKTHSVVFGGQSIDLPVSLVMHIVAIGGSLLVAFVTMSFCIAAVLSRTS